MRVCVYARARVYKIRYVFSIWRSSRFNTVSIFFKFAFIENTLVKETNRDANEGIKDK